MTNNLDRTCNLLTQLKIWIQIHYGFIQFVPADMMPVGCGWRLSVDCIWLIITSLSHQLSWYLKQKIYSFIFKKINSNITVDNYLYIIVCITENAMPSHTAFGRRDVYHWHSVVYFSVQHLEQSPPWSIYLFLHNVWR